VIRATLDTNVLATGSLGRGSPPDLILRRWNTGEFELVVSETILRELARTLAAPYFGQRLTAEAAATILSRLREAATLVESPALAEPVATHPEDDLILSTADSGKVDYLVTGDGRLRRLGRYGSIAILTPREFLDLLDARADEASEAAGLE